MLKAISLDNYPISSNSLEKFYYIDGDHFGQQYKENLSDFRTWGQKNHAKDWILFPDNVGTHLSIDETALTNGELYTVVTNKAGKGRKGTLVAIIESTEAEKVIKVLDKIPEGKRKSVEEITLDMANSMRKIVRSCFPGASRVIDRFHVQKLAYDALQEMRIAHRWDAINEETNAIKNAYSLTHSLRMIFSKNTDKGVAYTKMAKWFNDVTESGFKSFNTISATFYSHYPEILNFFDNRSTNASAESFNAKLKAFRATQRGVVDIEFFLYRVSNIYA